MNRNSLIRSVASIVVMGLILLISSKGLAGTTQENRTKYRETIFSYVLPGSTTFTQKSYEGEDEAIQAVYRGENGYVIETVTDGYAGPIVLLVGVDGSGKVMGLTVSHQHETFGLGAGVSSNVDYLLQYLGTSGEAEIGSTVDGITGATVSSRAVTKGVNSAVAYVTGADVSSGATEWGG